MFLTGNNVDNLTKIEQHDAVKIIKAQENITSRDGLLLSLLILHYIIFYKGCDRIISSI